MLPEFELAVSSQNYLPLGSLKYEPTNQYQALSARHLLQYFYEEQLHRMECLSQEPVLFEDVLCQIHDMVQPAEEGIFTLQDLKRQKSLAGILFNILFNLNKFIAFETRDPFVVRQVRNHHLIASSLLCMPLPVSYLTLQAPSWVLRLPHQPLLLPGNYHVANLVNLSLECSQVHANSMRPLIWQ